MAVDNAGQVYVGDCGWEMASNCGGNFCSYVYVGQGSPAKMRTAVSKDGERSSNITGITRGGHKKSRSACSKKFGVEGATEASMRNGADSGQGTGKGPAPMESLACGPKNYVLDVDCTVLDMVQDTDLEN